METSTERVSTLLEDNPHFSVETSTETASKILEDNEFVSQITNSSSLEKDNNLNPYVKLKRGWWIRDAPKNILLPNFGSVSPPDQNWSEEEEHEESEDDNDDTITIIATKVIKFIKNNFRQIKKFLTTEECKYLTKDTSFAKGSIRSFLIGTGIEEEINEVIKRL